MANNRTWSAIGATSTEAAFNTWGKSISDALAYVGMTNVYRARGAVTGSAAWTTETGSWQGGPYNNDKVVEIWTFPSSSLASIYIRLGYGQGNGYQIPRLTVKLGKTYNGTAGTVDGLGNTTIGGIQTLYSSPTSPQLYWLSCDDNGLAFVMNANNQDSYYGNNALIIDRYRNVDGSPMTTTVNSSQVATGAMIFAANPYNPSFAHHDMIENDSYYTTVAPCVTRGAFSTTNTNAYFNAYGQTQIYPWWSAVRSGHGVSKMICTYAHVDRPAGTLQSVAWLTTSTNRVIRTAGYMYSTGTSIDMNQSSGAAFAIWWSG